MLTTCLTTQDPRRAASSCRKMQTLALARLTHGRSRKSEVKQRGNLNTCYLSPVGKPPVKSLRSRRFAEISCRKEKAFNQEGGTFS